MLEKEDCLWHCGCLVNTDFSKRLKQRLVEAEWRLSKNLMHIFSSQNGQTGKILAKTIYGDRVKESP